MASKQDNQDKDQKTIEAIKDWERISNDQSVVDYLEQDTWHGVAIGFFLGRGFTLEESIALIEKIEL
jgi:hypothetical protein